MPGTTPGTADGEEVRSGGVRPGIRRAITAEPGEAPAGELAVRRSRLPDDSVRHDGKELLASTRECGGVDTPFRTCADQPPYLSTVLASSQRPLDFSF